ncbi:hypothetical protein TSAR_007347 [Trichomalopsis sarcophagae]|uniref:Uncharacterized protein n=1 Tax=Trichomalopsis sarcophagae TaxID=543379 RepID=A0A232ERL0_9HYME|nr:hypothetical protein TSAR_007347 [Trichomalopsis sarcophagae]
MQLSRSGTWRANSDKGNRKVQVRIFFVLRIPISLASFFPALHPTRHLRKLPVTQVHLSCFTVH